MTTISNGEHTIALITCQYNTHRINYNIVHHEICPLIQALVSNAQVIGPAEAQLGGGQCFAIKFIISPMYLKIDDFEDLFSIEQDAVGLY